MQRLSKRDFKRLAAILDRWFEESLPRSGCGLWNSVDEPEAVVRLAARLYKRGLRTIRNTATDAVCHLAEHASTSNLVPNLLLPQEVPSEEDLNDSLLSFIERLVEPWEPRHTFVVIDAGFAAHWHRLVKAVTRRFPHCLLFKTSEDGKNLDAALELLGRRPTETAHILAIGGGVLCDMVGLVAGISEQPVRYLPTTFLSAVDAAIGGKTGVNHPRFGKNQIGLFVPVERIGVHPDLFRTLDPSALAAGLCECIKHAWLQGSLPTSLAGYHHVLNHLDSVHSINLIPFIREGYETKRRVVEVDPTEQGLRGLLNFGHTVGHMVESFSHNGFIDAIPHGIAVGYGMLTLSKAGLLAFDTHHTVLAELLETTLARAGYRFPIVTTTTRHTIESFCQTILIADKKNRSPDAVTLALPPCGFLQRDLSHDDSSFLRPVEVSELLRWVIPVLFAIGE
jgi:3-dehydroquinate synthase